MGARGEERAARSIFRFERARTGLENFGCERGLGLSTHWQWSVMVTGGRASEQSSNRAIEQPSTTSSSIRCTVRSFTRHYPVYVTYSHVYYTCSQYVRRPFFANRNQPSHGYRTITRSPLFSFSRARKIFPPRIITIFFSAPSHEEEGRNGRLRHARMEGVGSVDGMEKRARVDEFEN